VKVKDARNLAADWVREHSSHIPGFAGAMLSGSTGFMAESDTVPPGSDIDL